MSRLGDWLNDKELSKGVEYQWLYGTSFMQVTDRSKFNPMRYLLGVKKFRAISPKNMLIQHRLAKGVV